MSNEIGDSTRERPFPGHENLYAQVTLIGKKRLTEILSKSIAITDTFLYDVCQQDQSTMGSPNIENLKQFRNATHTIENQFATAADVAFTKFKNKLHPTSNTALDLSLVEIDEMENVVNSELATEVLTRNFVDAIDITNQRLCALFGFTAVEQKDSPITEKQLPELLRVAMAGTIISEKVRTMLFRNYESVLTISLAKLLEEINYPLVQAGILPHLKSLTLPQKARAAGSTNSGGRVNPGPSQQHQLQQQFSNSSNEQVAYRGNASANSFANTGSNYSGYSQMTDMPVGPAENALFNEICNYLHTWRPNADYSNALRQPSSDGIERPARQALNQHEMIALLSAMQDTLPKSVVSSASSTDSSVSKMMKAEMLKNSNKIGINPDDFDLKREDEDAMDLVGMLFDVLMSERDFRDEAKNMMSRLVVPYTKAAVMDRRLFLTKAHPARKLLNALTEAVEGNQGDGPQERELLNKAEHTVDKLVIEFNEDIAIFELLENEMRTFLDQHRRRIDLAEKRAKEAQRGQERLETARKLATRELVRCTKNVQLPTVMSDFLSRYWTHHLSMLILRDGVEGQSWAPAIKFVDELLADLKREPESERFTAITQKRAGLESILASSGVAGTSAESLIQKLAESSSHFSINTTPIVNNIESSVETNSEVEIVVPQATESNSVLSESSLRLVFNKDALDYDVADAEFFKTLEMGAWLQLESSAGGFTPIKLAWISPISSRLMFVNRRGVRVLVVSVEELAQMKKQGKLIVHAQDSVFEQTMDRVLNRLKTDFA